MKSLNAFAAIPNLQYLRLYSVNPACREAPFLSKLTFERFDFEYGLYTTDEIARMVARHPHVTGTYFGAYGPAYFGAVNRVLVSGARKPELRLPEQQKQLERYVREFDLLVEQYRREAAPQEECP